MRNQSGIQTQCSSRNKIIQGAYRQALGFKTCPDFFNRWELIPPTSSQANEIFRPFGGNFFFYDSGNPFADSVDGFDLVITDLTMPNMTGDLAVMEAFLSENHETDKK